MKLKKIFHIAKPIYTQTPIFTISDEVLLQYLEYTQKSEEVGNESGLTKINLTEKKQSIQCLPARRAEGDLRGCGEGYLQHGPQRH